MKKLLNIFIFLCASFCIEAQKLNIAIIPEPTIMSLGNGNYVLPKVINIQTELNNDLQSSIYFLSEKLTKSTGYKVSFSPKHISPTISLMVNKTANAAINNEGYTLVVNEKGIKVNANTNQGLFYGIQSLLQLLPKEIESKEIQNGIKWTIPFVDIKDSPRFGWRGLMLDVSRHFFTKAEVKDFIDQMVRYKYNTLHWHLTDDEGWRVEIKSYPNLTKKGAFNVKREGYFGTFTPTTPDEPKTYGGFYTQEEIKEIVAYAKERFIEIVPEVDVPGHSLATVVAYPELSCTPEAKDYVVRSGEQIMNWDGAHPTALVDNTLCPANEKVYTFLNSVFGELSQLFPGQYIHIGGDECPKNFWEKTPEILALAKKEGLKDMMEVQSYFTKRLVKIITSKGKKVIGWDEILEGGLADGAAVMSWRGQEGGIEAAKQNHEVVMSPMDFCYIDYMQGDEAIESKVYKTLRLKKAYSFDPLPEGVDPKYVKGGQGNQWTEQIYNNRYLQYMTWPRSMALAEALWSPKEKKDWNNFTSKVEKHFKRLDIQDVKYSPAMFDPLINVTKSASGKLNITFSNELDDLNTHYSFDNSFPDNYYPIAKGAITPPIDAVQLKVVNYRGKEQKGRIIVVPISDLEKRVSKK